MHKSRSSASSSPQTAAAATAQKPGSLPALETTYKNNSEDPDAALAYAQALRQSGRLQRAAIILGPFIQDEKLRNANIYAEYAATEAAMGNDEDADKYARKAVALDPENGQGYHVLGIALDAEGKNDQAETAFRLALANWHGDPAPVLNNLGLNLAAQGYMDEAVATVKKAVALDPDRTDFKRNLRILIALQSQSPSSPVPGPVHVPKPTQG